MDSKFHRNEVLVRDDGTRHRLLRVHAADEWADGHAWLIFLGSPEALPYKVSQSELHSQFKRLEPVNNEPARPKSELFVTTSQALARPASTASIELSERAYARIETLVDNPDIFEPSKRHALLVKRAEQPGGGSPKTLLKDLRRWWQGGQTQDALLGYYRNSGRPETIGTAGRGRRKHAEQPTDTELVGGDEAKPGKQPFQLTQQDLDNIKVVIEQYYFDKKVRRTLAATLRHLHEEYYTYIDGNGVDTLLPADECPSYRQLEYFLKKTYQIEERETARKGKKRFALEDRSTQGSIQIECHGAGHIYEFDATIADVPLVSAKVRSDIVGKPTLYLIIDRHTRLIVGWYIGFENACYSAAMQAILSIGADKEELCRMLGIPYDPADWPAHGVLPEMFLADQGELTHKKARRIARSLRSTISNVPGMRPDWKPLVECGFAMLHQIIAPDTPGHSPDAEAKKRRAVNRDMEVALTLLEFTRIIVCAIIAHNKTMQVGYPLSLEQAADGVRPIPRELWAHSVRRRMGQLDRMNFEKVRGELLPRGKGKVQQDGIVFEKLHYFCPEAGTRGWLVEGRRERKPIDVVFDYRLVDEILVYSPDGSGESFVAKLTKDSVKFSGMSLKEVKRHFENVEKATSEAQEVSRQARFEYRQRTKPTVDNAVAETRAATQGVSRAGRYANTSQARSDELHMERDANSGVRSPAMTVAPTNAKKGHAPAQLTPTKRPSAQVFSFHTAPRSDATTEAMDSLEVAAQPAQRGMSLKERLAAMRNNMTS